MDIPRPKSSDSTLESFGKMAVTCFICAIALLLRGWAIVKLWTWFIVPLGAPTITFWHALGLASLITYLTTSLSDEMAKARADTREWSEKKIEQFVVAVIAGPMMVLWGWVFQSFMA